ncbi:hypothetical protein B0T16DRAFT_145064 [Cercophora newfieldiana]|uniref:Uncharacterized protein n=1 Tax=Cercophora newfieldiana TaxID=92897 RepID=A0AA40CNQ7_9PEZI|nr:hypothetical protein B0T16DRAFT_145064 [Cercophora newfieldiana]
MQSGFLGGRHIVFWPLRGDAGAIATDRVALMPDLARSSQKQSQIRSDRPSSAHQRRSLPLPAADTASMVGEVQVPDVQIQTKNSGRPATTSSGHRRGLGNPAERAPGRPPNYQFAGPFPIHCASRAVSPVACGLAWPRSPGWVHAPARLDRLLKGETEPHRPPDGLMVRRHRHPEGPLVSSKLGMR